MSNSFFGKLNHLVKSHINDIISPIDERMSRSRRKALSRNDIRRGLQGDVQVLRERVDDALAYQDELQARVDKLYQEMAEWDEKADKAVQEGREDDAREAIGRMQQAQREVEMLEADLTEHRYITQELISQVNMLEGVVQESEGQPDSSADAESAPNVPATEEIGEQIVRQLDTTRRKLSELISSYTAQVSGEAPPEKKHYIMGDDAEDEAPRSRPTTHPVDRRRVDDDFEARLSRLSKPEKEDDKK